MAADDMTREQVRHIDAVAINELGIPGVVLMENAGRNAASRIFAFNAGEPGPVAVVAGGGNNGGDGFVIARHLANWGRDVIVCLVAPREKITGDALINLEIIERLDHDIRAVSGDPSALSDGLAACAVVVDAVGGTGISGALRGDLADVVAHINDAGRPVVAVDIPTGLDCDAGTAAGPAVRAEMTVTFVAVKKGFAAPGAAAYTGEVVVVDIGVDPGVIISKFGFPDAG